MCFLTVSTGDKYDSCMSLERLQLTAAELKNFADQVKQGKNPVCTQHNKHHKPFCKIIVSPALIADHWSLFVDRWSLAGRHLIKNIYSFALTFLKEMLVETSWHGFWLCLTSVTYILRFLFHVGHRLWASQFESVPIICSTAAFPFPPLMQL